MADDASAAKSSIRPRVALALLTLLLAGANNDDIAALLRRQGIRAVQPPSPATDFTLPTLGGAETALSDSQGRWVLLTFFATWCGPCKSEMPTLQRLHEQRAEQGLDVVAISTDTAAGPVQAYAKQHGLTFPVLLDSRGQAAALYRASSIPVSYLIDPAGRIVGVSRGARDWSRMTGLIDDLLVLSPPTADAPSAYAAGDEAVELPSTLVPPTAEVHLSDSAPRVGRPFVLEVRVRWAGNFDEYLLHPPEVHVPEGIRSLGTSATTTSSAGREVVTYHLRLQADEPGSFALDPVEVRYTPRLENLPVASRIAGPTVQVQPFRLLGLHPAAFGGGLAASIGLGVLLVFVYRRRRPRDANEGRSAGHTGADSDRYEALVTRFDAARKCRIEGEVATFVEHLVALETELAAEQADPSLVTLVEQVRYGGACPPPEQLDRLQRRVEMLLSDLAPDPAQQERELIRLAER